MITFRIVRPSVCFFLCRLGEPLVYAVLVDCEIWMPGCMANTRDDTLDHGSFWV